MIKILLALLSIHQAHAGAGPQLLPPEAHDAIREEMLLNQDATTNVPFYDMDQITCTVAKPFFDCDKDGKTMVNTMRKQGYYLQPKL